MPEGFASVDDETLAGILGVTLDHLAEAGVPISEEMFEESVVYDTFILNDKTGDNISILLERPDASIVNEDMYIILLKMQLPSVLPDLSFEETADAELSGVPFRMAEGADGKGMVQRYYLHMLDDGMLCQVILTVTGNGTQTADEIIAAFQ